MWTSPKNFPTCVLLNKFCSISSTSISISLMLNPWGLPLSLETFNTEGIFNFSPFGSTIFCIRSPDTKRSMFIPTTFLSLFSLLLTFTNPNILIYAKQWVRALLLLRLSEPSVFYNHHTTQKIYLHHHHPNDHHHHHNSHHTTYLPTPL